MRSIALIDVNNFYASCERVFNPKLEGKAVVVLSNNDGCAIARNAKAKELGIKMGEPYFKLKDRFKDQIVALSSNYTLYADMSNRVMTIIGSYAPTQEVYSIDESFLELTGIVKNHYQLSSDMRARIKQWTGLPVCIGIGSSKTLAKLANHIAKKNHRYEGVCNLNNFSSKALDDVMGRIEVGEVWGVGKQLTLKLNQLGIRTALDLKQANPEYLRQQFSVVLEKTNRELNGIACMELEEVAPKKKEIISSRSFGHRVRDLNSLQEAVTLFTSKAAEKLRNQGSLAGGIRVFIQTSPFGSGAKYANQLLAPVTPTNDSIRLVKVALWALRRLYKRGYDYQKAGVMLTDITSINSEQSDLFAAIASKSNNLMNVMDTINRKMGSSTLQIASQGFDHLWQMKQNRKSRNYTTSFSEILECV